MKKFPSRGYKMPRSSSSSSKPKSNYPVQRAPSIHSTLPTPSSTPLPVSQPSLGQMVKEGIGFGVGSAIAQRAVSAVFGAPTINMTSSPSQQNVVRPCEKELNAFETCMKTKSSDDFCGNEQISYTRCLRLSKETS
jgi:hypothetical protein